MTWTPIVPKPYKPRNLIMERVHAEARRNRVPEPLLHVRDVWSAVALVLFCGMLLLWGFL
jgi:hypothetical protein